MVRRSTRDRKQTTVVYDPSEHASPSMLRKIKASSSSEKKRKRTEEDGNEDLEEVLATEDVSSSESESEESETEAKKNRRKKTRKTSTPKKAKEAGETSEEDSDDDEDKKSSSKRNQRRSVSKSRRKSLPASSKGKKIPRSQGINALKTLAKKFAKEDEGLAVRLISCWSAADKKKRGAAKGSTPYSEGIHAIALEFLTCQDGDIHATEVALFNFIFHCIGGGSSHIQQGTNIEDDFGEEEWADLMDDVTDRMEECPQDKVLVCVNSKLSAGQAEFRKIYEEFWSLLTTSILQNSRWGIDWITSIMNRLVEISQIGVADLRYAITTAVYNIGKALLRSCNELQSKIETASRQLKASKASQSQQKAQDLKEKLKTWKETQENASTIVQDAIMTSVFPQRYRDSRPIIRVASLSALGDYCMTAPEKYLQSIYLKYVGWMLFDHEADVRKAALQALLGPFSSSGMDWSGMGAVVTKYLRRLVEICTRDVDKEVQEKAMELILRLLENDMFDVPPEDSAWEDLNICPLKASGTPKFRRDGLCFVLEQLSPFDDGAFSSERVAADQISQLAQWLGHSITVEGLDPSDLRYDLADLVVDSLESLPMHKPLVFNWGAMLRALSSEESKKSDDNYADTIKQRVILRMLVSSARKSGAIEDNSERFTLALLRALPRLLLTFKSDMLVLRSLVVLPQFMSPDVFGLSSRRKEFQSLLASLCEIMLEATDKETLCDCALSLSTFSKMDHPRKDEAQSALTDVVTTLRTRMTELLSDGKDDQSRDSTTENLQSSLSLCTARLFAISKQCSISLLIGGRSKIDEEIETLSAGLSTYIENELESRKVISKTEDEDTVVDLDEVEIPAIWEAENVHSHEALSKTVSSSLGLILTELAWRVSEELKIIESANPPVYSEDFIQGHIIIRTRNRLSRLITSCFDMFLEDIRGITYSDEHIDFSVAVQKAAIQCVNDLRTLFPDMLSDVTSPLLQACVLENKETISAALDRFLHSLEPTAEGSEQEKQADDILLPCARGIATNFGSVLRQEVSSLVLFVAGHSKRATDLVAGFSKSINRSDPVRFLEVHMAALQNEFEKWADREPADVGDTPTDSQLTQNDEEFTKWMEDFDAVISKASRLAATLGVGRQRPLNLDKVLLQFFSEGLRFAFSTDANGEEVPLGCNLSFLSLLSKYVRFIRPTSIIDDVENAFDDYETQLRQNDDFEEDQPYIDCLSSFRESCGFGSYTTEDTDTVVAGSTPTSRRGRASFARPRMSTGTSVSSIKSAISKMDSIEEGDESTEEGEPQDNDPGTDASHERVMDNNDNASDEESTVDPSNVASRKRSFLGSIKEADKETASPSPKKHLGLSVHNSDDDSTVASSPVSQQKPAGRPPSKESIVSRKRDHLDSDEEAGGSASLLSAKKPSLSVQESDDESTVAPSTIPKPKRAKRAPSTVGTLSSLDLSDENSDGGSTSY